MLLLLVVGLAVVVAVLDEQTFAKWLYRGIGRGRSRRED